MDAMKSQIADTPKKKTKIGGFDEMHEQHTTIINQTTTNVIRTENSDDSGGKLNFAQFMDNMKSNINEQINST